MNTNFVNATIAAAGDFACSVDDVMTFFLDNYKSDVLDDPSSEDNFEYDYVDLKDDVIGVLIKMFANGILLDIYDAISSYLTDAGIDISNDVCLKSRFCKDIAKSFAYILLREDVLDAIFD